LVEEAAVPRVRTYLVAGAAATVLLAGAGQAAAAVAAPPVSTATVSVDTAHPAGPLAADFVGLSYEQRELSLGSFDAHTGNLVQLFRTLGASNVRIGGNTLDRDSLWIPAGQQPPNPLPDWVKNTVGPADISRLNTFLRATGWKAEVGINVGRWDEARAADQVRTMFGTLGPRLTGAACGNEPNAWKNNGYRPDTYGYEGYKQDFERCAAVVGSNRIVGPDTSSPTSGMPKIDQFAADEKSRLTLLTTHNYAGNANTTAAALLSPENRAAQVAKVGGAVTAARAAGLPIRLDETNSTVGGGTLGVSDTYASALWALDYSLAMTQAGINGLDFHGGLGVCSAPLYNGKFQHYTPICPTNEADMKARIYSAAPEFYGMLLAKRMGPGHFLPVQLSTDRNVTAYAVAGRDGHTRVALIQKEATSGAPVRATLKVGNRRGTAELVRLTGESLDSKANVKIQGASVDRRGRLPHRAPTRVPVRKGTLTVDLPAGSAVLITLC
jgi:hypothetical protein